MHNLTNKKYGIIKCDPTYTSVSKIYVNIYFHQTQKQT